MRWPIRNQIMLPLLAAAVVSLTAVGAINAVLAGRRTCARVEQQLRQVISVLATSSFPLTNSVLRQMRDLCDADFVLVDASGDTAASTIALGTTLPQRAETNQIEDVALGTSDEVDGRWYFHTVVKLPLGASATRSGTLHVLFPQDEYRRAWREAFLPSFFVGLATTLLLAAVAYALANRMGRTIARLREEVLRIARGDFRAAELPTVDDEIRDLSVAINRTAAMLAEYEQQVRQSEQMRTLTVLGASIAHQLRNAVTGCRMALDLHSAECPVREGDECLEVAGRQLRLMESQLQRFLRIGRRPAKLASRDIEFGELVEDLLPLVRPAAQHAGVTLDCRISAEPLTIEGEEEALSQVVLNLLLNAIEAAQQSAIGRSARGSVSVDVRLSVSDAVALEVRDSGTGPAEHVASAIFDPFVTSKAEGAGLGLAVAHDIVVAHGGTIDWNRENGMTASFASDFLWQKAGAKVSTILVVDDEPSISWGLSRLAKSMGHEVDVAPSAEEGLCIAAAKRPDVLVLDVRLPGMDGVTAMESFARHLSGAPIIVITAFGDLATAMDAIQKGAFEYVVKPFDVAEIRAVIERALRFEPSKPTHTAEKKLEGMLGRTPAMQNVFKRIALAANSDAAVLLRGESGVGKEMAANAIHRNSTRSGRPLVAVDAAMLEGGGSEANLFGVAADGRGSSAKSGLAAQANGGTLFIDEIARMPLPLQLKLLRALDYGEVMPVGAESPLRSRFRVISATKHDLRKLVEAGQFRHDLYFRLCTFEIELPPLRDRRDDIALLADSFAVRFGGQSGSLAEETLVELERRPWFGNVRELRIAMEHALVLARHGSVMPEHLPPALPNLWESTVAQAGNSRDDFSTAVSQVAKQLLSDPNTAGTLYDRFLQQVEPPLLATVMSKCGQRCAPAARVLGLHRTTLKKKLTQYEIEELAGDN